MRVPAQQDEDDQPDRKRQEADPDGGVDDARLIELVGVRRSGSCVDVLDGDRQRPVKVAVEELWLHVVVEDCLAVRVGQEHGPEAAAGI
jgi:hypothetical protein